MRSEFQQVFQGGTLTRVHVWCGRAVPDLSTTQHPTLANHTVHGVQVPQVHQYQYIYTGGYVTW